MAVNVVGIQRQPKMIKSVLLQSVQRLDEKLYVFFTRRVNQLL